jgi:integrase
MTRRAARKAANGEGSVYQQKNGLWVAAVTSNGERAVGRAKTRAEAERLRRGFLQRQDSGALIVGPDPTLAVYLDRWLEARRESIKPWTYRGYRTQVRHITAVLGKVKLRALTPEHVVALVRKRMEDGASPKHVRGAHQCLRTALADALRERRVTANVASREMLPRGVLPMVRRYAINPYTEDEARRFLKVANGDRIAALWILALKSGMRQAELLGLPGMTSISGVES